MSKHTVPSSERSRWGHASLLLVLTWLVTGSGLLPPGEARAAGTAQSERSCAVVTDTVVTPARIRLGETAQVRLTLTPDCPEAEFRSADIVLAIDQSLSMLTNGKLTAAKVAARDFVDSTDLSLQRIAVVGFYGSAQMQIGLSDQREDIFDAIDAIDIRSGTNMQEAIDVAQAEIEANGRPDAKPVIVLISDGSPNQPPQDPEAAALRSANAAKLSGTEIYAIGLGSGAAENLLRQVASAPENYFFAPGNEELAAIYESIALVVGATTVRDLVVRDVLNPDSPYVDASAAPAPAESGAQMRWNHPVVPAAGLSWTFQIKPSRTGTYLHANAITAEFRDVDGSTRSEPFPNPPITVLDPVSRSCSAREMWTVLVHSFPDPTGKGPTGRGCNLRFDNSDWMTGTAFRIPTLTYRLTDATGDLQLFEGQANQGPGRVDQWLYIRTCEPPPYTLRLVTSELDGYDLCPNGPLERQITLRDFRPRNYRNTLESFGFVR